MAAAGPTPEAEHAQGESERRERSQSGARGSASSAAEAARAAWAAAQHQSSPFSHAAAGAKIGTADPGHRRGSIDRRGSTLAPLRLASPRPSLHGSLLSAERALSNRRSAESDAAADEDALAAALERQRHAPLLQLDWRLCARIDADSRLQLVSAAGAPEVLVRYERLLLTGNSLSAVCIGGGGKLPPAAAYSGAAGRQPSQAAKPPQEAAVRPGLFTAEFNVQASSAASQLLCSSSHELCCQQRACACWVILTSSAAPCNALGYESPTECFVGGLAQQRIQALVVAAEHAGNSPKNGEALLRILSCEDFLVGLQPSTAELAPIAEAQPPAPLQLEGGLCCMPHSIRAMEIAH
jgi:hypothetical protein